MQRGQGCQHVAVDNIPWQPIQSYLETLESLEGTYSVSLTMTIFFEPLHHCYVHVAELLIVLHLASWAVTG